MQQLWVVFISVFLAELGDKTQLATLLFATDKAMSKASVFLAASCALVLSSLLAVLLGGQISQFLSPEKLKLIAGLGFVAIGIWTLWNGR